MIIYLEINITCEFCVKPSFNTLNGAINWKQDLVGIINLLVSNSKSIWSHVYSEQTICS